MGRTGRDAFISVVMPVHNALPFLDRAIESILQQTCPDFEFVIYDDASKDGSTERIRWWAARDQRILVVEGERNLGPAGSSNQVVALSSAPIVARMDADDISHPDRLRAQLELLHSRPDVVLVGTLCDLIDGTGSRLRGPDSWRLTQPSWLAPFPHGSIMYRRTMFDEVGGYREECKFWEDQDFVLRAATVGKVVTIPRPLYQHRHSNVSTRLASRREMVEQSVDLMCRAMRRLDAGRDYEDLLRLPADRSPEERVEPQVFRSLGSLELWGGGRPRLFRRLLRRGQLRPNLATAAALLWTGFASLSPSLVRKIMNLGARLRNRMAAPGDGLEPAVEVVHPRDLARADFGRPQAPASPAPPLGPAARSPWGPPAPRRQRHLPRPPRLRA